MISYFPLGDADQVERQHRNILSEKNEIPACSLWLLMYGPEWARLPKPTAAQNCSIVHIFVCHCIFPDQEKGR